MILVVVADSLPQRRNERPMGSNCRLNASSRLPAITIRAGLGYTDTAGGSLVIFCSCPNRRVNVADLEFYEN